MLLRRRVLIRFSERSTPGIVPFWYCRACAIGGTDEHMGRDAARSRSFAAAGLNPTRCARCGTRPRCARTAAGALLLSMLATPSWGDPAYSFRNPFHPEQCERALRFAEGELALRPGDQRAQHVLAEALLCCALRDDVWSLDATFTLLKGIAAERPDDFFVQLQLFDALRKRFPLANETQEALLRVRRLLADSGLGSARPALAHYVAENGAALARHKAWAAPRLAALEAAAQAGQCAPQDVFDHASLLALAGLRGLKRAEQVIDSCTQTHGENGLAALARAEVGAGRVSRARAAQLYAEVERRLCAADATAEERGQCPLARYRLARLEAACRPPSEDSPIKLSRRDMQ